MHRTILEPLRWMEDPARVTIIENGGLPKTYLQIVTKHRLREMCVGRPVEELPRILTIVSPTHHLVSALALDTLFNVEPPPLAVNLREALLETQFLGRHLRRLYFLLSTQSSAFEGFSLNRRNTGGHPASQDMIHLLMRHVTLAQEASKILGGREDHPISVIPGGVSRFLKQQYYDRLSEIALSFKALANKLTHFLTEFKIDEDLGGLALKPVLAMSISEDRSQIELHDFLGKSIDQFPVEQLFAKIGFHEEPWTYKPFTFLNDLGWKPLNSEDIPGVYFVGPFARLISRTEIGFPASQGGEKGFWDEVKPSARFTIQNAYRALILESYKSAIRIADLYRQENLTGPTIRNIPTEIGDEGFAAIEAPEGLVAHRYRTDKRGIVREIDIVDAASQNNALKCLIVRNAVEGSSNWKHDLKFTKARIEKALLPF
ncbi:MAG: hypothetical protein ACP5U1_08795 [Desulfomonilaceae bacterium]